MASAEVAPDVSEVKQDSTECQYDLVIYGATGFTGAIAATEFIKRYATSHIQFKWAIAGRNEGKLSKLRTALQAEYKKQIDNLPKTVPMSNTPSFLDPKYKDISAKKQDIIDNLPLVIADVNNAASLLTMVQCTKLVISCIGPYRLLGEKVVETCAQNGTHYVDICGEPDFMERSAFKYYETAKKTGSIIVSACGFDSIPSDLGCAFIDNYYRSRNAVCSSIDGFLTGKTPDGYAVHHTTLKAAVLGMSEADQLRALRKQIAEKDYRVGRRGIPRIGAKQKINKATYFWSDLVQKYSMLFPFADSAVVSNSQGISTALLRDQGVKDRIFPQYAAYISFNGRWQLMQAITIGGLGSALVGFEYGRQLLMGYPEYMTFGVFSEAGPTEKQRSSQTFSFKFFAKGYSESLKEKLGGDLEKLKAEPCDMEVKASVSGVDIAYSGTSKILVECAIVLLQEEKRIQQGDLKQGYPAIQGGVFTPSTVFGNTSLVERLNEAGILFEIEE